MPIAIVTGASKGLGRALTAALVAHDDWEAVIDARRADELAEAADALGPHVHAIPGDVADPVHRAALIDAAKARGGLDVLVLNASRLGPSPQPPLADYPLTELERVYAVNVFAPLALVQAALPLLEAAPLGRILAITSDAAVEPYEGWGGYGSSKAALEQLTQILAAEKPGLRVYVVDPGDMNTEMHQAAFPGEDISDRPPPEASVPGLLELIGGDLPSGRYQARAVEVSP
jgi:NAD(P)-dependent dehydrogenase (short-subunit alcohol dehydrogenase family)